VRYILETGFVRYVPDAIIKVSCLTAQSSAKISDSVTFFVVDSVCIDISRQNKYLH